MRVLAIDPGYDRVGFAVAEHSTLPQTPIAHSACFTTNRSEPFPLRLHAIGEEMERLIAEFKPELCAIEKLYFSNNQKTAMGVAEVRGMLTYLAEKHKLRFCEYTPLQIKVAVTGDGKSTKDRVAFMVDKLATTRAKIILDDEYDAIAIALTCLAIERA